MLKQGRSAERRSWLVLFAVSLCAVLLVAVAVEADGTADDDDDHHGGLMRRTSTLDPGYAGGGRPEGRFGFMPRRKPRVPPLTLIATIDGIVTAVKSDTGSKLWSIDLGGPLLSSWQNQSVFQGTVIIPNTDGSLLLFSQDEAGLQRLPITVHDLVEHSPFVADDGTVYVAQKTSRFMLVDRASGEVLSEVASDAATDTFNDLGRQHGGATLLIGRYEYLVKAVDPRTQDKTWSVALSYMPLVRQLNQGYQPPILLRRVRY